MTPTEIAEMQADAMAGTPGDWRVSQRNPAQILAQNGAPLASSFQSATFEYRDEANARRIARLPRLEVTVAAQADEIARLTAGREVYRDCLWREIMGGNNCLNQAFICDNPKGADCECQQKFDRIAKHAESAALETKP